jgi:hypothetical protein
MRLTSFIAGPRRWVRGSVVAGLGLALIGYGAVPAAALVAEKPQTTYSTNGRVSAILRVGDRIYIAGSFTAVRSPDGGSVVARNRLAALDANTGAVIAGWAPNADADVLALATDGTRIYAGGLFSYVNGVRRKRLVALNAATGAVESGFKAQTAGHVHALVTHGSILYVGGNFSSITDSGGARAVARLAAVNAATGAVDLRFNPAPELRVRALGISGDGSELFVGGDFTTIAGASRRYLAALNRTTGALDTSFTPAARGPVFALDVTGGSVYAGMGGGGGRCTAFTETTGSRRWEHTSNGNVQAVTHLNGVVYCGGHFGGTGSFGGQSRQKLAAVDAAAGTVTPFAPRVNSPLGVWALKNGAGSHLYAGGDFTRVDGVAQQGFARFADS